MDFKHLSLALVEVAERNSLEGNSRPLVHIYVFDLASQIVLAAVVDTSRVANQHVDVLSIFAVL